MSQLDPQRVGDYFAGTGTVERWWTPDTGPLSFHYDAEIQILEDHVPIDPSWRVLDVGTGRGRFGTFFAEKGCRVVGVDVSPEMLEEARQTAKRCGVEDRFELRQAGAEDLSEFEQGEFDVVLCMELFDHLPDLARALSEMRRVLRPGGTLLFTYVPSESLYGFHGNVYRWVKRRLRPEGMLISRTYSLGEIKRRLREAELDLDDYWGLGILCVNAQTRLFQENPVTRLLRSIARTEARRWPYYDAPRLARHGAHVVGRARPSARRAS